MAIKALSESAIKLPNTALCPRVSIRSCSASGYDKRSLLRGIGPSHRPQMTTHLAPHSAPCAWISLLGWRWLRIIFIAAAAFSFDGTALAQARHGIAMHGEPALAPDFR